MKDKLFLTTAFCGEDRDADNSYLPNSSGEGIPSVEDNRFVAYFPKAEFSGRLAELLNEDVCDCSKYSDLDLIDILMSNTTISGRTSDAWGGSLFYTPIVMKLTSENVEEYIDSNFKGLSADLIKDTFNLISTGKRKIDLTTLLTHSNDEMLKFGHHGNTTTYHRFNIKIDNFDSIRNMSLADFFIRWINTNDGRADLLMSHRILFNSFYRRGYVEPNQNN